MRRTKLLAVILLSVPVYLSSNAAVVHSHLYSDCTYIGVNKESSHFGSRCFCFSSGTLGWRDICSTFQVHLADSEDASVVLPAETSGYCRPPIKPLHAVRCALAQRFSLARRTEDGAELPPESAEVCFTVKSDSGGSYTVSVSRKQLNGFRMSIFLFAIFLFFLAEKIVRNSLFYYTTGVCLGTLSLPLLLIFLLSAVFRRGTFVLLLGIAFCISYVGWAQVLSRWDQVVSVYWMHLLGYLLLSALVSFAACLTHGPVTERQTLTLLTWAVQVCALVLLSYGVTHPTALYLTVCVLVALLCVPSVLRLIIRAYRQQIGLPCEHQLRCQLLTEDEYREQGETCTRKALEELQLHCLQPNFHAWDTVLRLRFPHRFAEFVRSGSHLTSNESQVHDQQYGPGGDYYENIIFHSNGREPTPDASLSSGARVCQSEPEHDSRPTTPNPVPNSSALVPLPPPLSSAVCPYPAVTYLPLPQLEVEEDMELF